jgi:tetraacyldisaccharide 4'-kinase
MPRSNHGLKRDGKLEEGLRNSSKIEISVQIAPLLMGMFLKILLYPFSLAYGLVTGLRNHMYNRGLKPVATFDLPVIAVGNLTVGGTGKTPMVEYLIRLLRPDYKVATLSRGYGRSTKGFRIAGAQDSATTLGDEPFQFYKKFNPEVTVAVGEERALAIPLILQEQDVEVILLDDAYQHRSVKPSFNILLSDYNRPFYKDLLLPAGRLRESRVGASRADVVIVTKCPIALNEENLKTIKREISEYGDAPVFFTTLAYGNPVLFGSDKPIGTTVILITGIANPVPFISYVEGKYSIKKHLAYGDHKNYERSDLEKIREVVKEFPDAVVFTTEKDMVKLSDSRFSEYQREIPFYYLPITVQFLKEGSEFDKKILIHVNQKEEKK